MFTVDSLCIDGTRKRSWSCTVLQADEGSLILEGVFEHDVEHRDLGVIARGTRSVEYFPAGKWFSVFIFYRPDGQLRNFYCNICLPIKVIEDRIEMVDLDIDIVVWPDGRVQVLDEDDYAENVARLFFSESIQLGVNDAVSELMELISTRSWIFAELPAAAVIPVAALNHDPQ